MEKALKQRLIGAVVLVVSGVIFIPLLLDGAGHNSRFSRDIKLPPEPVIKVKTWDELKEIPPKSTTVKKPLKIADTTPSSQKKPTTKPAETKAKLSAWALQLGSFGQQTNALVLQDRLRAKGYRAYILTSKSSGKLRYKVRVGPDLNRTNLEKVAKRLKAEEKIASIVVTHQ